MRKTALVTGASIGFGVEFAKNFARDGHNVVIVARSSDKLNELAAEIRSEFGVEVYPIAKDLSDMRQVQSLFDDLQSQNIQIDFLVNNAGFGDFKDFLAADYRRIEQMIDLNIKSLTKMSHLFAKPMVERGFGKILQVASTAAFQPGPGMAVYFATKAYVLFLSEAMSDELRNTGVSVTTLCPGASETGFQAAAELQESKLVKGKKLPGAKPVADFGYRAMMNNKLTVVHGFANWIGVQSVRVFPRKWVLAIVRRVQSA
jgi:hypothetical protein